MPRKHTEEEINTQKEFMYERTVTLIFQKPVTTITIEDILDAVWMAKGSFYRYYKSKEEFLYDVIKKNERIFFEKMVELMRDSSLSQETVIEGISTILMDKKSLFLYLQPNDTDYLLRKLPSEYRRLEEEKSMNNFISFCEAMRIKPSEEFFGALTYLMLALQAIVTSPGNLGESGKKRAVTIMARSIYKLLSEEIEKNGQ